MSGALKPKVDDIPDSERLATRCWEALTACRIATVALERITADAYRASEQARQAPTRFELLCEDEFGISEGGPAAFLEKPLFRSPILASEANRDDSEVPDQGEP